MENSARLRAWAIDRHIAEQEPNRNGFNANIVEELGEYLEATKLCDEKEIVDSIADIRVFCATELVKMGYNIDLVDSEVLEVIESRTGEWCDVQNKFMKDMSKKDEWHIADYSNCKEQ